MAGYIINTEVKEITNQENKGDKKNEKEFIKL